MENAKISAALVKAQKEFGPALKSSTNPHFKSRYADLSACVEAVVDALNNNGIMLMQKTHDNEHGVAVETVFIHESGESISSGILRVPAVKQDAQGYGSALTYTRRYSLMAACGIAPEDDDGNAASKGKQETKPITPLTGVLEQYEKANPEDAQYLRGLAADLVQLVEYEGKEKEAFDKLEAATLDNDPKLALWEILKPNSKTRSAIKRIGEERKREMK